MGRNRKYSGQTQAIDRLFGSAVFIRKEKNIKKGQEMNKNFNLNDQQKQLMFDYSSGLTTKKETVEAERLISSNEQAAKLYSKLKIVLLPLQILGVVSCPDDLAERTILRLKLLASGRQ